MNDKQINHEYKANQVIDLLS